MQKLNCKNLEINYLVVNKPIKNIYLRVKNGYVQINCNKNITKTFIENFICKNIEFILNNKKSEDNHLFGEKVEQVNKELFKKELPPVILKMVKEYSNKMNLYPNKVSFRFNKSKWGSCSSRDNIIFNYYLAQLPYILIEYIVVHELAHIKYKNHSKDFWSLVEKFMPDRKERIKKLREFERSYDFIK